jgi:hypothetical protein
MIRSQFQMKPSSFCLKCSSGEVAISHAVKMKHIERIIFIAVIPYQVPTEFLCDPFCFPSSLAEIMLSICPVFYTNLFQIKTQVRGKIVKFIPRLQISFACSCFLEIFWSVGENMILKSSPISIISAYVF